MSTTYRAAYYYTPEMNSAGINLTLPEHAHFDDEALTAEALAEAKSLGLIGLDADANQITEEEFFEGLHIGDWTE